MTTRIKPQLPQLRLFQLLSSNLPVGAFSYSQGLEWAVEAQWVHDAESLQAWLLELLQGQMQQQELPLLDRMFQACAQQDMAQLAHWSDELLACRETSELRAEEINRGRALTQVLISLEMPGVIERKQLLDRCQLAGFAWACHAWGIGRSECLSGFAWAWLENTVLAAVKTIPLGQSAGQQTLFKLSEQLPECAAGAMEIEIQDIGYASLAVAFASAAHETQYTRLYRS